MRKAGKRRMAWGLALVAAIAAVAAVGAAISGSEGEAQRPPGSTMDQRLDQLIGILSGSNSRQAHEQAIDEGMEILYGGLRPLPSKGPKLEETIQADAKITAMEMRFAEVLQNYAGGSAASQAELRGRALDLKLFIEQMNEVASAVGDITSRCGEGDNLEMPPCNELQPLLDEATGSEVRGSSVRLQQLGVIRPGYQVKLRGPWVPPWFGQWEHDVRVTEPMRKGQCTGVFKETRGLMVRLHFAGVTVVRDPWATPTLARGTLIPIWYLSWAPTQHVKVWNLCNVDGVSIRVTEVQRVKQDHALNFFWRYYRKDP